jgi:hypothetical protein
VLQFLIDDFLLKSDNDQTIVKFLNQKKFTKVFTQSNGLEIREISINDLIKQLQSRNLKSKTEFVKF